MIVMPAVSQSKADEINAFIPSGRRGSKQYFRTFQAAMYLAFKSGRPDIDWSNILLENRRWPYGPADDTIVHGNTNRYELLISVDMRGRYFYAPYALNIWLAGIIKANVLPAPQLH